MDTPNNQSHFQTTTMMVIPFVMACLFLIYFGYRRRRPNLPPGPRPWPITGNLRDIKQAKCLCFAEWAQTFGPIMSVWLGPELNIVVSSPNLAKEVLKEQDQHLANRHRTRAASKFSRDGKDLIWADYGPHYVKVRKACNLELFSPKRLEALRPIREDEVSAMVESIFQHCTPHGRSLELRKFLGAVAFNNITRLVLGKRFMNSEGLLDELGTEFKAIVANGTKIGASTAITSHAPWLRWMFPQSEEELTKHGERRDRLTRRIMEDATAARQVTGESKQHFVDALLTLQDQYDLSEDTIIALLWNMITAGMDTTAIAVEWAMAEVLRNPRAQEKAQEELDEVVGRQRVMSENDIPKLPYLTSLVKESMRLHPPTPLMLPHKASAKVKIGGYEIPKGAIVHVNVWAVGRDEEAWKEPLEFRPERFFVEDVDMKGHDFRLLPFGAGRRVCPGAQLGINLVTSMLGHLLHHFKWSSVGEIDISEAPGLVTYMKCPVQAVATPRLPSNLYHRVSVET